MRAGLRWVTLGVLGWVSAGAQVVSIDATAPVAAPVPVAAKLGAARNPDGRVIGVNSQYLSMDGKPWIPVMGEFHFSRYPAAEWEQEILKMKAAGVSVISSYVIWIHHEQVEGQWDWAGQKDLRRFAELCGKHGMYLYPRIGPWAHAEVRNGGFPDWVVKNGGTRHNDPVYLKEVQSFFAQIGKQLQGEYWKDGGPVIGIQLENEYREAAAGQGRGSEHIRTLKEMAEKAGMDVPLYSVTGWDGAAIPLDAVVPMFGGYPDAPWDGSNKAEYGNEIYAFRFDNRVAGDMGAVGGRGQNAASSYKGTPFLTTEVGDGGEDTYFRRPVLSADDVAAIAPVMLGGGVNLLGYYMFHGGVNPVSEPGVAPITLEETQLHHGGDATDTPERSYDFQAPLGEYGQVRESLKKLKLVHYFLEDFGAELAPMTVRRPDVVPSGPKDTSVVRVAARTKGEQGFVFVNNYVRGLTMPERLGFQVALKLPGGVVRIPEKRVDLPAGAFGIWPVNLPLVGVGGKTVGTLRYSTAQLFKREVQDGRVYYFFFALPGVAPEFAWGDGVKVEGFSGVGWPKNGQGENQMDAKVLRVPEVGGELALAGGISVVVMPEAEAEEVWRGDDPSVLVETSADVYSDGKRWVLQSKDPEFKFIVHGATKVSAEGQRVERDQEKNAYRVMVPKVELQAKVTKLADAKPRQPWVMSAPLSWRPQALPIKPAVEEFAGAAVWKIEVSAVPKGAALSDVMLEIGYQGDEARLSDQAGLVDDNFWNGLPWSVGLKEVSAGWRAGEAFELRVLPLPKAYPMYLEGGGVLRFGKDGMAGVLDGVKAVPVYEVELGIRD